MICKSRVAVLPGSKIGNSSGVSTSHPISPSTCTLTYGRVGEFPSWTIVSETVDPEGSISKSALVAMAFQPATWETSIVNVKV